MVVQPEISRVAASAKFSSALDPTTRSALTTVTVNDGQTVLIAGLISRDYTDATRKVPILGDIPFLGVPFRRSEIEDKNTEIIVFITPRIVREDEPLPPLSAPLDREQSPLSASEQRALEGSHSWELRRRAMDQTVSILSR
jgi:type II secretory pathway component GspD/PulD (secretin)